jgi:hypothetical protein
MAFHQRAIPQSDDRVGVEVGGRAGADRTAQRRQGALGFLGPRGRRPAGDLDDPNNTMSEAERWAAEIKGPAYAIDAQTAITVTDGSAEVISEGFWKLSIRQYEPRQ